MMGLPTGTLCRSASNGPPSAVNERVLATRSSRNSSVSPALTAPPASCASQMSARCAPTMIGGYRIWTGLGPSLQRVEVNKLAVVFGRPQCAVKPPSTGGATPSTRLAAGLHNQRAAAATSSGRPGRPIGWSRIISFIASGWFSIMSAAMGVSIKPGQTALMRMPSGAESIAALLVSPMTPCLVAWYVARPACPTRPPREES